MTPDEQQQAIAALLQAGVSQPAARAAAEQVAIQVFMEDYGPAVIFSSALILGSVFAIGVAVGETK